MDEFELLQTIQQFNDEKNELIQIASLLKDEIDSLNEKFSFLMAVKKGDKGDTIVGPKPIAGIDYHIPKDGYTPKKGVDYFTDSEINKIKKEIIPRKNIDYFDGEDGKNPIKGLDYFTNDDIKKFKKDVTPIKGVDYFDGKDGSPDTGEDIVNKINELPIEPDKQIDAKHIKNLPKYETTYPINFGGGNVASFALASKLVPIDLSDQCDGSNKSFLLSQFYSILLVTIGASFPGVYLPVTDFTTPDDTHILLGDSVSAPESGQSLLALVILA